MTANNPNKTSCSQNACQASFIIVRFLDFASSRRATAGGRPMKLYGLLFFLLVFSSSVHAANCVPTVVDKKVVIEYLDGEGDVIHSEEHRVRSKKKYDGLVSNAEALKVLGTDLSGKIKIRGSKLDMKSGGMTTKVSKRDGTAIARIGGCPVSKLKFFARIGSKKSPFIHKSVIALASEATVEATIAAATSSTTTTGRQSTDEAQQQLASNESMLTDKMAEMQQCVAEIDQAKLRQFQQESQALNQELEKLCKSGKRSQAQGKALEFALKIRTSTELNQIRQCMALMEGMPGMPQQQDFVSMASDADDKHVCDGM